MTEPFVPVEVHCPQCGRLIATWTQPDALRLADGVASADFHETVGFVAICPDCRIPVAISDPADDRSRP